MNREIGFRAWDGVTMHEVEVGLDGYIHAYINGDPHMIGALHDGRILKQIPVMQFTGLKDMHEKEIFEGDILEFTDKWEWYGRKYVFALLGASAEKEIEIRKQYEAEPMERRVVEIPDCYEWILSGEVQEYWAVIGNIHENADLLAQ